MWLGVNMGRETSPVAPKLNIVLNLGELFQGQMGFGAM